MITPCDAHPETRENDAPNEGADPAQNPASPAEDELDLDIEEQGDGDRLKEGFTGQER